MKKLNNKGFSLVELIIVIAIMAILVGVVGTQVIPYLEQSRFSKDLQVLSAWNTDAVSAYSTCAAQVDASATYIFTIDGSGVSVSGGTSEANGALEDMFKKLAGTSVSTDLLESKEGKSATSVEIVLPPAATAYVVVNGTSAFDGKVENK